MVTADQARTLLLKHGVVRSQPPKDWKGPIALPPALESFYREVGPVDVTIDGYGNPYFLPSLRGLWEFQAGYRWNGLTKEPIEDWNDDWLVVADESGDPFIFSSASGAILHAHHGEGDWDAYELFPDLNAMAACLAQLGSIVQDAADSFTDEDSNIRPDHRARALARLTDLLGSNEAAQHVLDSLGWAAP